MSAGQGTDDEPGYEVALDMPLYLGEGAIWHEGEAVLYFTDIVGKTVYRYDPARETHSVALSGETVAGITIQEDGGLLLFQGAGRISRLLSGQRTERVRPDIEADHDTRFNDVVADPEGRVYCGTMPGADFPGRMYRLDPDGSLTLMIADAGVSNGMDFTPDGTAMYHTNTTVGKITRYAWDRATGDLGEGEDVITGGHEDGGNPDGMTLDANGDIWSASWGGWGINHYRPDGTLVGRLALPAQNVTSIAFSGPDHRTALITSAGGYDRTRNGPLAGTLFRADLGVGGRPPFRSAIGLR